MKRINLLILLGYVFFAGSVVFARPGIDWIKKYGGAGNDYGSSIIEAEDGSLVIVGKTTTRGAGENDVLVLKLTSTGDTLWMKTFGGPMNDVGAALRETADGGFVITGTTESFGAGLADVWLIKIDADGVMEWSKTYGGSGGDYGYAVQQAADGGYIIAGQSVSFNTRDYDAYIIRTDVDGNVIWTNTMGGPAEDGAYAVVECANNDVALVGHTATSDNLNDVWLIRLNKHGEKRWSKTFGGPDADFGYGLLATDDRGFIIAGNSESPGDAQSDVHLIKTDEYGKTIWTKSFGGEFRDYVYAIDHTTDGGFVLTGQTVSDETGFADAWVVKTDSNGQLQWDQSVGEKYTEQGFAVCQTRDYGYVMTGYTKSTNNGHADVLLVRFKPETANMPGITVSLGTDSVLPGDTLVIPVYARFPGEPRFSSVGLTFSGYSDDMQFIAVDTTNCVLGASKWMIQLFETPQELSMVFAGSEDMHREGALFRMLFKVKDDASPVTGINVAKSSFNEGALPTISSGVTIRLQQFGDVSLNNEVTLHDASLILKYLNREATLKPQQKRNGNVNLDGKLTEDDAFLILKYVVGMIDHLPYTGDKDLTQPDDEMLTPVSYTAIKQSE